MKQEKDLQLNNKKNNPAPRKKNSGAAAGKVRKALKPTDGTAKKKEKNASQNSKPHKQKGAAKPEKSKKTFRQSRSIRERIGTSPTERIRNRFARKSPSASSRWGV